MNLNEKQAREKYKEFKGRNTEQMEEGSSDKLKSGGTHNEN